MKLAFTFFIFSLLISPDSIGQTIQSKEKTGTSSTIITFEKFVNENALSIVQLNGKLVNTSGMLTKKTDLLLTSYEITPLEDKVQYFQLEGSSDILKVESLYRLRATYNSNQNIKK